MVGSHLLSHLSAGNKPVRAIFRNQIPDAVKNLPNVEWVNGDVLDIIRLEELMEGIDQVYHCAAMVSYHPGDRDQIMQHNVQGTANVVNAALLNNVKKLVSVSSVAAIGRMPGSTPVDETAQWTPRPGISTYSKSKYLSEMEVWRGIGEGLNAVIVNPSIILGEADWNKSSSAIFKSVYDEFPWYSEGVHGFVDVQDVVHAMVSLMDSSISGERFILNAENMSFRTLFDMIADSFGKKKPSRKVNPLLAGLVWRMEALKSAISGSRPRVTKEMAANALTSVLYNNGKLIQHLPGFTYTPLKQSVERICTYFLQQKTP